ncbi:MAG: hypothetical protein AAF567_03710 [Actinomycetota bacterium]
MKRVLIGELGGIVTLGLRELIHNDDGCRIVGEPCPPANVLEEITEHRPDVVLLDLDDSQRSRETATAIISAHPAVKVIACSSSEPRMRVFPPFHRGESYIARMSPEQLIDALKTN